MTVFLQPQTRRIAREWRNSRRDLNALARRWLRAPLPDIIPTHESVYIRPNGSPLLQEQGLLTLTLLLRLEHLLYIFSRDDRHV